MSQATSNLFDRADVFHLFDPSSPLDNPGREGNEGNAKISEAQYTALVHMMAANLSLTAEDAERLFPSFHLSAPEEKSVVQGSSPARVPPLCAHLAREGVEVYWSNSSANTIPDVRCCDARDIGRHDAFPASGQGPHVHCLYCFHTAIEQAPPPGRGVPPPVVADFRDPGALQAHQREHHERYLTYLKLLEDSSSGNFELEADMLSDEGKAACESAAEQESRHVCYMAAVGTAACPIVVFYCAECDCFAPLVRFELSPVLCDQGGSGADLQGRASPLHDEASAWISTDELNVVLSRLLLSCHVLHMFEMNRFAGSRRSSDAHGATDGAAPRRHVIFMYKPILFHEGVEEEVIEAFEDGSECTHAAAVLPFASVAGATEAQLLLLATAEEVDGKAMKSGRDAVNVEDHADSPRTYGPAVIGFAMEWASEELLQTKLDLVLRQHELGSRVSGTLITPYHAAMRWVYIEDTEEWVYAHVLYHRIVATPAELPRCYADDADEGIRVVDTYTIDAPLPVLDAPTATAAHRPASAATSSSSPAIAQPNLSPDGEQENGGEEEEVEQDSLAPDGCPYSMESRTIDFFARMTALAKAMHELSAWRLSIDENKDGLA